MRERLEKLIKEGIDKHESTIENYVHPAQEFIADYLIENGVVVPLLQTGQIVYRVSKGRIWEVKIWKIEICGKTISYIDNYDKSFLFNHIGKGVFLTREDAEAKLKGGEAE